MIPLLYSIIKNLNNLENDQQRFEAEIGEESHYWFVVSDFVRLMDQHGLEKLLTDVVQFKIRTKKIAAEQMIDCPFNSDGC